MALKGLSLIVAAALLPAVIAQSSSCSASLTAKNAAPSVASGYVALLVATGLTKPRSIKFDSAGNLLVVEQNQGVSALTPISGSCPGFSTNKKTIITDGTLNHGLEYSSNSSGDYLYASSTEAVYRWTYDAGSQSNISAPTVLINNMTGTDHTTRTLLLAKTNSDYLIVSRGSLENLDPTAAQESTAISQVKMFDIANATFPLRYSTDGTLLGWGLRNEVGLDQAPGGNIYGVENSADSITRDGKDIHENNPGEELNMLGSLIGRQYTPPKAQNFGYPSCLAAWNASDIPDFTGTTGQQFAIAFPDGTNYTDADCAARQAPTLTFQAHMAPLDILFNPDGSAAWITFHGSWNRDIPVGYKLSVVTFSNGYPTEPSNSTTALHDILTNVDNTKCPGSCFRPVGLAWDKQGRLFMSSDATGEIYAIYPADGTATSSISVNSTTLPTPSTTAASSTTTTGAARSSSSVSKAYPVHPQPPHLPPPPPPPCHDQPPHGQPLHGQPPYGLPPHPPFLNRLV